jgi:gamma-tubulin complex component 2
LYEQLLRAAAAPYLAMLEHWLYRGRVADPYDEFCIAERTDVQRASNRQEQAGGLLSDSYWESRYTLRERHVWAPLARCADQLLVAGKYLNVVRDARTDQRLRLRREARTQANASQTAGGPLVGTATAMADEDLLFPHAQPLVFGTSEQVFSERVDAAHRYASRTLLDLLLGERQLLARLRSIKSLFFLERGDFFQQFCDAAFDELQKPVRDISAAKLDALLDMTLRSSTAADDEFGDDLSCHLQQYSLLQKLDALYKADPKRQNEPAAVDASTTRLKGIDALTFDFKVRWPESLVLSRATLTKYQLVFRHLLRLKQVWFC